MRDMVSFDKTSAIRPIAVMIAFFISTVGCAQSENRIKEWVEKNPDVIMKALMDYQKKQQEEGMPKADDVKANAAALFENAGSPRSGDGKIKIAYFFDFNCGHCAHQSETIEAVLAKKMDVQVIYKHYPFLRPDSEMFARAALAANLQGKYKDFYHEFYKSKDRSENGMASIAKKIGVDMKKWKTDMNGEAVTAEIAHVRDLAQKMKITGTPVLAIAPDKIFPGRVDQLEDIIKKL